MSMSASRKETELPETDLDGSTPISYPSATSTAHTQEMAPMFSEEKNKISPDTNLQDADIDFPDGGLRAWLIVLGVGAYAKEFNIYENLTVICE